MAKPVRESEPIEVALRRLDLLDRAGLATEWQARFGAAMPGALPERLARLIIAYALQSGAKDPLPDATRRRKGARPRRARSAGSTFRLRAGTVLLRDWHGQTHRVEVLSETRLHWQGKEWRSLSAIAKAITGTSRSGPAFFGLIDRGGS